MKICIIGAGAIGGLVGAGLTQAGENVTYLVRGHHLAHLKRKGMRVLDAEGRERLHVEAPAVDHLSGLGSQDVVLLAVKAHQIAPIAADLTHVIGPETLVVPLQNGLPWWYFQRHGGAFDGRTIAACDPTGALSAHIPADRIIGSVVYPAAELEAPGVVRHVEGDRFPLGELDGTVTPRIQRLADAFVRAGFKAPILDNIRAEIWLKLWGNLSFNPISALTHATLEDICKYPHSRTLAAHMMEEAQRIANALGIQFRVPLEKRIAGAERVGRHKTSTLQDVQNGRALELEALIGAVVELGRMLEIPTPYIDSVYALSKLLEKTLQEEDGLIRILKRA
jgi:2-dehydropantoate 2-reductase